MIFKVIFIRRIIIRKCAWITRIPVFSSKANSTQTAQLFFHYLSYLCKILPAFYKKVFIAPWFTSQMLSFVLAILQFLSQIIPVGAITKTHIHFPTVAQIFFPAKIVVPV